MFISQANNSEIPVFALRYLSYTASFVSSRGCRENQWPGMSRMCWSFFIGIVVWITRMCWNFFIGIVYGIFASQGLRFGSPFPPPLADLEYILRIRALIFHWLRLPVHVSNQKTFYTEHMLSTKCKQKCHFPFWFQWKHLSRLPKLWNFSLGWQ